MRKIKRDDNVLILAGKDRGKVGVVRQIVGGGDLVKVKGHRPKVTEDKVFVTGLNMVKRHKKQQQGAAHADHRERDAHAVGARDAGVQELQQARPRGIHHAR